MWRFSPVVKTRYSCNYIVDTWKSGMADLHFETVIQPWGNSLGLRITRALSNTAHLERGTVVTVAVVDGGLLIKPKPRPGKP